jgi:hypothetical protein
VVTDASVSCRPVAAGCRQGQERQGVVRVKSCIAAAWARVLLLLLGLQLLLLSPAAAGTSLLWKLLSWWGRQHSCDHS